MQFIISCEQFSRLSRAALLPNELTLMQDGTFHPHRPGLVCVRLEYARNAYYAIATNGPIMVIEFLGETEQPPMAVNVKTDPQLLAVAAAEAVTGGDIVIEYNAGFGFLTTRSGSYIFPGNCINPEPWPELGVDWRKLINDPPSKSYNAGCFSAKDIAQLGSTSPSGDIVLPQFFSANQPAIVRDKIDPGWLGLFLVNKGDVKHAKVPDWVR